MLMLLAMVMGPSDAELVERFKSGDRAAFAEIFRRYKDRVYTLCMRWLHDPRVAEETAQDVFIALFRSLQGFRGEAQLSTWVYRVVVNHCKNRRLYGKRRHEQRHESIDGDADDDRPARQVAAEGPEPSAGLDRGEAEVLVRDALDQLDEETRHIIVLRDVEDLSYEEIAEILSLPRGTVKSRLHRARAQLAAHLARKITREDVL